MFETAPTWELYAIEAIGIVSTIAIIVSLCYTISILCGINDTAPPLKESSMVTQDRLAAIAAFVLEHDPADCRVIDGQVRIASHATMSDWSNGEWVDTRPITLIDYADTFHQAKVILGY